MFDAPNPQNSVVRYLLERKVSEGPDAAFVSFQDGVQWNRAETLDQAPDAQIDSVDLLKFLVQRMPYLMITPYSEVTDEFPRTPTLRVQEHELRSRGNSSETWDREGAGLAARRIGLSASGDLPEDGSVSEPSSRQPA